MKHQHPILYCKGVNTLPIKPITGSNSNQLVCFGMTRRNRKSSPSLENVVIQGILVTTRAVVGCHLVTVVRVEEALKSIEHALGCVRVAFIEDRDSPCTAPEWRELTNLEKLLVTGTLYPDPKEEIDSPSDLRV